MSCFFGERSAPDRSVSGFREFEAKWRVIEENNYADADKTILNEAVNSQDKKIAFCAQRHLMAMRAMRAITEKSDRPPEVNRDKLLQLMTLYRGMESIYPGSDGQLTKQEIAQVDELIRVSPELANELIVRGVEMLEYEESLPPIDQWTIDFVRWAHMNIFAPSFDEQQKKVCIEAAEGERLLKECNTDSLAKEEFEEFSEKIRPLLKQLCKRNNLLGEEHRSFDIELVIARAKAEPRFARKLIDMNADFYTAEMPKADSWTTGFVKWALRSRCDVEVFVRCPALVDMMMKSVLDKTSGLVHGNEGIRFRECNEGRFVCMRADIEGDNPFIPIQTTAQRAQKYVLRNHVTGDFTHRLSVQEMISRVEDKKDSYSTVGYGAKGFMSWNAIDLGSTSNLDGTSVFNQVNLENADLTSEAFYRDHFPDVLPVTYEALEQRYPGQVSGFEKGKFGFALRVTRDAPDDSLLGTHAFWEVILPNEDGKFNIYPFSAQARELLGGRVDTPWYFNFIRSCHQAVAGIFNTVSFLARPKPAGIHYPDENIYMTRRQGEGELFILEEKRFTLGVHWLKEKIRDAQKGKFFFILQGPNCAGTAQEAFYNTVLINNVQKVARIVQTIIGQRDITISSNPLRWLAAPLLGRPVEQTHTIEHWLFRALVEHDEEALETVIDMLLDKLYDHGYQTQETVELMQTLIFIIRKVALKHAPSELQEQLDKYEKAITDESWWVKHIDKENTTQAFHEQLRILMREAFGGCQMFKAQLLDSKFNGSAAALLPFVNAIRRLPYNWMRNLAIRLFNWALGSNATGYALNRSEPGRSDSPQRTRVRGLGEYPGVSRGIINLPPQLYNWSLEKRDQHVQNQYANCIRRMVDVWNTLRQSHQGSYHFTVMAAPQSPPSPPKGVAL